MYKKVRTEHIGNVFVDAGLIWVGDPCYIMSDNASNKVDNWITDFCEKIDYTKDGPTRQAVLGEGVGYAISSGFGDGSYPVYVEISDEGSWGERVSKIIVDFELFPKCESCGEEGHEEYECPEKWLECQICGRQVDDYSTDICSSCQENDE